MDPISWHNEKRKIIELKPAEYNPRQATEKDVHDLNASLEKFNLADPIIINKNNTVIGGHFRLRILQQRGVTEVDVRVPDRELNPEEERQLNLRLNKNNGQWDFDALANFDEEMLKDCGFDPVELDRIFQLDLGKAEKADNAPALRSTEIKLGDIFQLGRHRLMCADATKRQDIEALLAGARCQMVFTDPPYNVNYKGGSALIEAEQREGIENDSMERPAFLEFLHKACQEIIEVTDGAIYICMGSSEMDTLKQAFEAAGGKWSNTIIWVKNTFTLSRSDYQHQYEPILYGWPKGIKHYFIDRRDLGNVWEDLKEIKTEFKDGYTTISFQGFKVRIKGEVKEGEVSRGKAKSNIWRYNKPSKSELHPTMKPVAMICEAIRNSSLREQIVLDPFLGSGSTLMACELENRTCYGIELDPQHVQCAIDRWEEYTGQKAQKLNVEVASV